MRSIAFAAPLLPGKTEADLEALASVSSGARRADHEASRRRAGITREASWLQRTPDGDVGVVLIEAEDIGAAMGIPATSQEPFDVWFSRSHQGHTRHGHDRGLRSARADARLPSLRALATVPSPES